KSLNLSGETQVKFEAWKERWDYIVSKELADIEEHLLDAEDAADRFMIPKGKKILKEAEEILNSVESSIENILKELDELLESEESSRMEVEALEPAIKDLRRVISQNRYQFGKADQYFDKRLDELEADVNTYHQETEDGNYMEAKQLVARIKEELAQLQEQIEAFPSIYKKAKHDIPSQLDNLLSGLKEMRSEGYFVEHLEFDKEIRAYQERIPEVVQLLEDGQIEEANKILNEIVEKVSGMYEQLEQEALAKRYLENHLPSYQVAVTTLTSSFEGTKTEVEELRKAYYIEDVELEKFLAVGKRTADLKEELHDVMKKLEDNSSAHTELRRLVETGLIQLEELEEKHNIFKKQ